MKTTLKILGVVVFVAVALVALSLYTGIISLTGSGDNVSVYPATSLVADPDPASMNALTFEQAVASFVPDPPARASFSEDQRAFLLVLELVESANYAEAELIASELMASSDSQVRVLSKKTLAEMFWIQQKWDALVHWIEADPTLIRDSIVESEDMICARAFATFPPEEYQIPSEPSTLNMSTIISGQAMVEVEINGQKKMFAIDTGADLTVVTDDIVEECAIQVGGQVSDVGTSTSATVEFQPGLIHEMRVGNILVRNHPVYVMNGEDLEFSLLGITIVDIDGIIGLPFFMKLAVTMDFDAEQITFARPETSAINDANLFWLGSPLVRLTSEKGVPLVFYLDTGANRTRITRRFIDRLSIDRMRAIASESLGAGGSEVYEALEIDSVGLRLGNYTIFFEKLRTQIHDSHGGTVVSEDGLMGIDVAAGGAMHIDFANSRFDLEFPEN